MSVIRDATIDDVNDILSIYAWYIKNTAITFEYETPSYEEFKERMERIMKHYPYLVIEKEGVVKGYAYARPYIERKACDYDCEVSVYIDHDSLKEGMGKLIYRELEKSLKNMGIVNIYASIATPKHDDEYLDNNSLEFHRHMGFRPVAVFSNCGYKFSRWYDLVWVAKTIGEYKDDMPPFIPYPEVKNK